jgi:hypothetical protein
MPETRPPLYEDWDERYEIVRKIGAGGFADVFEAYDHKLGRPVALKIIADRRGMSARVVREVEAATALSHPGIVALYDYFSDGEQSYLVWELIEGESLDALVDEIDDATAVEALAEVLDALVFAHSQGVIHRDIKPQNIMLDYDGRAKVMDFGIARLIDAETLTTEGDVLGTFAYMSPEQAEGRRAGPASDVYSAAIVLYELLAGFNPVRGDTAAETLSNVIASRFAALEVARRDLPRGLVDAVELACSPEPADRPWAAEFEQALRAALASGRLHGRRHRVRRLLKPFRRSALLVERTAGAALAALVVGVLLTRMPAYPQGWTVPAIAFTAGLWFVVPGAGLAWLLGVLAFPLFNVAFSVGVAYVVLAVALYWLTRGRPLVALWPALAVLLTPVYAALLVPAAASVLGRVRGIIAAAWAGAGLLLYLLIERVPRAPFTGYQKRGDLGAQLAHAGNPVTVVVRLGEDLLSPPAIFQMLVWAGFALAIATIVRLRSLELRLWGWSVCLALVAILYRVVPIVAWHHKAPYGALLLSVCVAAVVIVLPVIVGTGGIPEEQSDERP